MSKNDLTYHIQAINQILMQKAKKQPCLSVLEAGSGSTSHLNFGDNAYITAVDISRQQLDGNSLVNEKIVADLQTYDFPVAQYDVIVCWDVLEHLNNPAVVLRGFVKAMKVDGCLILAMTKVLSLEGQITKFTPHWFHIFTLRHLFGNKGAGSDFGPFPTYLRFSTAPCSIRRFAQKNNLRNAYFAVYDRGRFDLLRKRHPIIYASVFFVSFVIEKLSLSAISAKNSSQVSVWQKSTL
jgi:SAM-dependent methyltransferase